MVSRVLWLAFRKQFYKPSFWASLSLSCQDCWELKLGHWWVLSLRGVVWCTERFEGSVLLLQHHCASKSPFWSHSLRHSLWAAPLAKLPDHVPAWGVHLFKVPLGLLCNTVKICWEQMFLVVMLFNTLLTWAVLLFIVLVSVTKTFTFLWTNTSDPLINGLYLWIEPATNQSVQEDVFVSVLSTCKVLFNIIINWTI